MSQVTDTDRHSITNLTKNKTQTIIHSMKTKDNVHRQNISWVPSDKPVVRILLTLQYVHASYDSMYSSSYENVAVAHAKLTIPESSRSPPGVLQESFRSPFGVLQESSRSLSGFID